MDRKYIYPPRPKTKMHPNDLGYYEESGAWVAQRKFNGSRNIIHIQNGEVYVGSRHGREHLNYTLPNFMAKEILTLNLDPNLEYWLDSELMNKLENPTNEIILYDVLQAGRYLFGSPDQMKRIEMLKEICRNPTDMCRNGLAFQVTEHVWMADTYYSKFVNIYNEALENPLIEGLVLRKKKGTLDAFGATEYETNNLIRCRKPSKSVRGYNF